MDPAFWKSRWAEGRIGFHEGVPNTYLVRHLDKLVGRPRVLVPMCGKSVDLAFLAAHGHDVTGVELVEDAVKAFFDDHHLTPVITQHTAFVEYSVPSIRVLAGNVFATDRALLGPIDAIYDRAGLVALPDDMRRDYVDHLRNLASKGSRVLLVSYEYDQSQAQGPPFSVEEGEVRALFDNCEVELLSSAPETRIREGWPPAVEKCFSITL
jgi:thiopurine S-methyltransferase